MEPNNVAASDNWREMWRNVERRRNNAAKTWQNTEDVMEILWTPPGFPSPCLKSRQLLRGKMRIFYCQVCFPEAVCWWFPMFIAWKRNDPNHLRKEENKKRAQLSGGQSMIQSDLPLYLHSTSTMSPYISTISPVESRFRLSCWLLALSPRSSKPRGALISLVFCRWDSMDLTMGIHEE